MGIKGFFRAIGNFFKGAAKDTWTAFESLLKSDAVENLFKTALGNIVNQVVQEVQSLPINGQAKRSEAFKRIGAVAAAQGLEVKNSLLNALLELAVSRLKAVGEQIEKA